MCLSGCLSVGMSVHASVFLSFCMPQLVSGCLSLSLSVTVYLSSFQSVWVCLNLLPSWSQSVSVCPSLPYCVWACIGISQSVWFGFRVFAVGLKLARAAPRWNGWEVRWLLWIAFVIWLHTFFVLTAAYAFVFARLLVSSRVKWLQVATVDAERVVRVLSWDITVVHFGKSWNWLLIFYIDALVQFVVWLLERHLMVL